jgi:hypothetical protein
MPTLKIYITVNFKLSNANVSTKLLSYNAVG